VKCSRKNQFVHHVFAVNLASKFMRGVSRNTQFAIAGISVALAFATQADPLANWRLRQSNVTNTLNVVAYGGGQFVAVGEGGTILTSPDGSNWMSRVSGTTQTLHGVTFGLNRFIVVGHREPSPFSDGIALTSPDGIDWESHTNALLRPLFDVVYGNGVFVAMGIGAYTSVDGSDWEHHLTQAPGPGTGICFGNGLFAGVVLESYGASYLVTSTDGMNWNPHLLLEFPLAKAIAFGAGRFVAVGGDADLRRYSMIASMSTNGINWSAQNVIGGGTFLNAVTYGGNRFFALGANFTPGQPDLFATSLDGLSWNTGNFPSSPPLRAAAFGADTFVVVGNNGTILQSDVFPATPVPSPARLEIVPGSPLPISIQAPPGTHFRLEYVNDLSANANWQELGTFWLSGNSNVLADPNTAGVARRFYRAVVLP
jgi:hypothetical protein